MHDLELEELMVGRGIRRRRGARRMLLARLLRERRREEEGEDEDEHEGGDEDETEDEAGVRRILLKPLMERTFAARALRRDVLRRAIVQSLIQDLNGSGESENEPTKAQKSDRAAPKASA